MDNPPYMFDYLNVNSWSQQPGVIHSQNTGLTRFFQRWLLQKAISVFKWELPKNWAKNYFLYVLYCIGNIAVVNTDAFGVICQMCGLYGYDIYYRPTHATITNPLLQGILRPRIGKECTLIRLTPDYCGIWDLITHYADLMGVACRTLSSNLWNTIFSYVFAADNQATANSFKALYDQIASGYPAAVIDKKLLDENGNPRWNLFTQNAGQNYIADKVLSTLRQIEADFDTEIGIPNANTDKRERLITDEVNSNNIETLSKCSLWLQELKQSVQETNNMFGLEISVDWRFPPQEGGTKIGARDSFDIGDV